MNRLSVSHLARRLVSGSLWCMLSLNGTSAQPVGDSARVQTGSEPLVVADSVLVMFDRICRHATPLWGVDQCGPMIVVDRQSRAAVANTPLPGLGFRTERGRWRGMLPDSILVANTATRIGDARWSMVLGPIRANDPDLADLLVHEAFHRVQPSLGLNVPTPSAPHLDTEAGRVWLRLELRALSAAVQSFGPAQRTAVADALLFRRMRYDAHPGADTVEAALEIQEGLAAYAGAQVAGQEFGAPARRVAFKLDRMDSESSYGRTFAYATGPAIGMLLDSESPDWRKEVGRQASLHMLFARAFGGPRASPNIADARARGQSYGYAAVAEEERERGLRTRARLDSPRRQFTVAPLVTLAGAGLQASFDPTRMTPLEGVGTVYGVGTFRATWSTLVVERGSGALLSADWTTVKLSGPVEGSGSGGTGPGWRLVLAQGWRLEEQQPGRWVARSPGRL